MLSIWDLGEVHDEYQRIANDVAEGNVLPSDYETLDYWLDKPLPEWITG